MLFRSLLQRAYPPVDPCRPCAPSGSHDAWEEYLIRLVGASGCGVFDPHASGTIAGPDGRLRGLVLASRLSPDVGHIAQVAVDIESRGAGMGRHLVDSACACLAGDGCRLVTLFVDERNRGALALYASLGFRFGGRFLSAGGAYPRRSTRPLAGGATITRR